MKSLLHEPCGCFEQTSSTTYPMVMALRYLKSHKSSIEVQAMIEKATKLLKEGYLKLMGYECKNGGYEWYSSIQYIHIYIYNLGLGVIQDMKL